jgi:hypothetical protein
MKPSMAKVVLKHALLAKTNPFFWGSPGIGKSAIVGQVADEIGYNLLDLRSNQMDNLDQRGMIYRNENNETAYAVPSFWPKTGKWVIFLDEFNSAPPLVQASFYQLLWDRRVGDYVLPEDCVIVAAGNLDTDRAVTNRMSTANASRFAPHIILEVDYTDWNNWALTAGIRTEVIFYHKLRNYAFLHQFDPAKHERTFPCPRTWELLSRLLDTDPPDEIRFEMFKGTVGEAAAADFLGFLRILDKIVNPDLVMMKPGTIDIPNDPAVLYALCAAIAQRAKKDNMDRIIQFANRLPDEFSTLLVITAAHRDASLQACRPFHEWAASHPNAVN